MLVKYVWKGRVQSYIGVGGNTANIDIPRKNKPLHMAFQLDINIVYSMYVE